MSDALDEALRLQGLAAAEGFDWPDLTGVWAKLEEEIGELREAQGQAARREELGDLLFMLVNLARHLQLEPAAALQAANLKFERRFGFIIDRALSLPPRGDARRLDAMELLWQEAKRLEKLPPGI